MTTPFTFQCQDRAVVGKNLALTRFTETFTTPASWGMTIDLAQATCYPLFANQQLINVLPPANSEMPVVVVIGYLRHYQPGLTFGFNFDQSHVPGLLVYYQDRDGNLIPPIRREIPEDAEDTPEMLRVMLDRGELYHFSFLPTGRRNPDDYAWHWIHQKEN